MHTHTHTHTHTHIHTHCSVFTISIMLLFVLRVVNSVYGSSPKMVSEDSLLNGMHQDWYLTVPGRPRQVKKDDGKD